ncbi:PREDICTED: zinc finger protein 277-like, partial [Priapulus caudatus]|uniref:Zinc finger protein 277-like n=1 Tax=Priapulus caudatus TaxID=37621 RepID=A0ABM1F2K8_PRICU
GLGKDWRKVQSQLECENERDDTDIPADSSQSETENIGEDHENDKDWTDWVEEEKERVGGGVVCLFCSCSHSELDASLTHMKQAHQFDLKAIISSQQLSFYQQVKLVNFIRRQMHQHRCPYCDSRLSSEKELEDHMQKEGHVGKVPDSCTWDQPQYFFPTYENDNLLSLLDDDNDDDGGSGAVATVIAEDAPATRTSLTAEDLADLAIS